MAWTEKHTAFGVEQNTGAALGDGRGGGEGGEGGGA